jgi:hypothetical protein
MSSNKKWWWQSAKDHSIAPYKGVLSKYPKIVSYDDVFWLLSHTYQTEGLSALNRTQLNIRKGTAYLMFVHFNSAPSNTYWYLPFVFLELDIEVRAIHKIR